MRSSLLVALAASLSSSVSASALQGFNYGSTKSDGVTFRVQSDFESLFSTAKNLVGTSGFTSARLYTTIQGGSSTNEPTQAIPAAISQGTSLLLGLWASGGQDGLNAELTALNTAISKWETSFTDIVVGISVGSEDLYRISPTGIAAKSGYGADPATIVSYIGQVRSALANTALSKVPIGHVDTWTAWVNGSNSAVVEACDWIGMDAYPYFQNTMANGIEDGKSLFLSALSDTQGAAGGKPVWVTETGWPVSGSTSNLAVPSTANAKTYWDQVGCPLFGTTNTYWFTIEDDDAAATNPSFGITSGNPLSTTPFFDLSCSNISESSSSTASTSSATAASSAVSVQPSSSSSGAGSGSVSVSSSGPASSPTVIATGGGGLSPNQGAGNGVGGSSATQVGVAPGSPSGTGNAGTSGNSTGTGLKTTAKPTGSSTSTGAAATQSTNAGAIISGSVVCVLGAFMAAVAAL